ncbi:MAG: GIY-YIG nuclease family protein [Bdellovibrionales bacterium]|jgi:putative endonuclease
MWYVYFLKLSNNDIYVGFTGDLKKRVGVHNRGDVVATKPYLPAHLKSYVAVETEEIAMKLEKYFKSGSGKAIAYKRLLSN